MGDQAQRRGRWAMSMVVARVPAGLKTKPSGRRLVPAILTPATWCQRASYDALFRTPDDARPQGGAPANPGRR